MFLEVCRIIADCHSWSLHAMYHVSKVLLRLLVTYVCVQVCRMLFLTIGLCNVRKELLRILVTYVYVEV